MPVSYHGSSPAVQLDPRLQSSSHVFIRVDAVRRPLVAPYEGPFPVLSRTSKTFVVMKNNKPLTVSVDRLKPVSFLLESAAAPPAAAPPAAVPPAAPAPSSLSPPLSTPPVPSVSPAPATPVPAGRPGIPALDPVDWPLPTRFGRRPRPPVRLNL